MRNHSEHRSSALRRLPSLLALSVLIAGMLPVAATAQVHAGAFEPPVPSDCTQDVTAEFNTWLATVVPDGADIFLRTNGCYLSNGTISFENRHNISIFGPGRDDTGLHGCLCQREQSAAAVRPRWWLCCPRCGLARPKLHRRLRGIWPTQLLLTGGHLGTCVGPRRLGQGTDGVLLDNVQILNSCGDGFEATAHRSPAPLDVRVAQTCHGLCLDVQPGRRRRVAGQPVGEQLHRDFAAQMLVAGSPHRRHAPFRQWADQLVAVAEQVTFVECGLRGHPHRVPTNRADNRRTRKCPQWRLVSSPGCRVCLVALPKSGRGVNEVDQCRRRSGRR